MLGTFIDFISDYRFIRSSTKLNASRSTQGGLRSTIAEANLDDTRSIFVRSRERSTTYRVKRSSDVLSFHVEQCAWIEQLAITGERICLQCFAVLHQ